MKQKTIYNCHTHIFTHENIPDHYFKFYLVHLTRSRFFRWIISGGTRFALLFFRKKERVRRFKAYLDSVLNDKQEENFVELQRFYPSGTRFVILPMDMALMGAGKVLEDIDAQRQELAKLAGNRQYKDVVIPFAHIDPRRVDSLQRLTKLVEEQHFRGVKIYPPLGYGPNHPTLMDEVYPFMVEKNIPLIAHCSPGSVNSKEIPLEEAHAFADPENYKVVMAKFPKLRICLGHFGGIDEWKRHLDEFSGIEKQTWLSKIRAMMNSGKYPNLYADISYTIFHFQENATLLSALLEEEHIAKKVLFGSDFYMAKNENYSEKRLSIDLRSILGEDKFWLIANTNPKLFLAEL